MLLSKIKGLKFPDPAIIHFFFKKDLDKKTGSILELGAGNGNNLSLFFQYGWKIHGVDISSQAVDDAVYNFEEYRSSGELSQPYAFTASDIVSFIDKCSMSPCEVLSISNCFNHLEISSIKKMLQTIAKKKIIVPNGLLFMRLRSHKDYRYGKGNRVDDYTFRMDSNETNEEGLLNTFFSEYQIVKLISEYFDIANLNVFTYDRSGNMNDFLKHDSDIALWCNLNCK